MADLALAPCGSYQEREVEQALRTAVEAADAMDFVVPGMRIAIKANLVAAMKPESAGTVHPSVVRAMVKLLRERGASVVIGDSPGGVYTAGRLHSVYQACGMEAAVEEGAQLNEDFSVEEVEYPGAVQAKRFPCTAYLLKADAVIDLCKLKTHGMMGMTCAVKNFFGAIPGTIKPEFHYKYPNADDFADVLVDLYEFAAPRLCVCDAVIGMEGNGPTQGTPREIGCLLVSKNGHLLDLACAGLIGLSAGDVPTLRAAVRRGLVGQDLSGYRVFGNPADFAVPDFRTVPAQSTVHFRLAGGMLGKIMDKAASRILTPFPKLVPEECVGCGKCAGICPAKAIVMKNKHPRIDRGKCIHCFCCQEFCPKGALKVGRLWILRLLGKSGPSPR